MGLILIEYPWNGRARTLMGQQIPDFPTLLGVSGHVATEYLARMIIHDFCHAYLPTIEPPPARETYHNAVSLTMGGGYATHPTTSPWEELILRECTDPTFFARADIFFREIVPAHLTLVQQMVLHQLRQWYLSPFAERQRAQLWGITSDADRVNIDQRVSDTVAWLAKTSFAAYSQPTALPPWSITL